MGKLHRIKRSFHKMIAHDPWQGIAPGAVKGVHLPERRSLAFLFLGVRVDGSRYIGHYSHTAYHPLMQKLLSNYEAGVAHSDTGPLKG